MTDSSSDDGGPDPEWVFYRDRPEWKDVTPIPQDDGPHAVVQIAYSDKFRDIYDYLRAVMKNDERSERALHLTHDAAIQNPANYSVWHFRRVLLQSLNKDLKEELRYCDEIIESNPKNYQVWHHRKLLVEILNDPSEELQFTETILRIDAKNYHAWQYRQWVIKAFDLYEGELMFINNLLEKDVRNNSAWNQRYFVFSNTSDYPSDVIESETRYTMQKIRLAPHNESSWNYFKGILFLRDFDPYEYPGVWEFCEELCKEPMKSPYLLSFMIDCIEEHLSQKGNVVDSDLLFQKALEICQSLAGNHDTIRKEYWNYVYRRIDGKFGKLFKSSS